MKRQTIGWLATLMVLASAGSMLAHHALGNYDTTKAVHVKGTVVLFQMVNPHSILILDEKSENGKTQRWAIDGPTVRQLTQNGFAKDRLKAGDVVEVCGYVTRAGVESERTVNTEPITLSLKAITPRNMIGKIMDGELLVMPDGQQLKWSDYGIHKCFDSGNSNNQTK